MVSMIQKNKDHGLCKWFCKKGICCKRKQAHQGNHQDKGLTGPKTWYDVTYEPKEWKRIAVPGYWEDQGIKDLNGVVWYRKEIDVPASMTGKLARVFLGRIVDADIFIH